MILIFVALLVSFFLGDFFEMSFTLTVLALGCVGLIWFTLYVIVVPPGCYEL